MNFPELRASDDDREEVVSALQRHTAAGRLSLDEYTERVDRALAARTHGELAAVVDDLPAEPTSGGSTETHQLAVAFLIAIVALVVVGGLVLLLR
ncbi:DUF1707 domain-containing protein [Solwaraspora sp. WMMD1047]|uniref:DUF1707 SHOCT-like domain-containing protein n=1 Tax=Solwaraspora sp. WMMD1047 TaxID=3016102 RepID=UPI0024168D1D|nr:DUF1707 domain-containing protein [Solwaraspora sp. WMMD1047]MDG4832568.1 DUF1707 domain-containing protein [Solwaraspora sp. WMMD1047]